MVDITIMGLYSTPKCRKANHEKVGVINIPNREYKYNLSVHHCWYVSIGHLVLDLTI